MIMPLRIKRLVLVHSGHGVLLALREANRHVVLSSICTPVAVTVRKKLRSNQSLSNNFAVLVPVKRIFNTVDLDFIPIAGREPKGCTLIAGPQRAVFFRPYERRKDERMEITYRNGTVYRLPPQ